MNFFSELVNANFFITETILVHREKASKVLQRHEQSALVRCALRRHCEYGRR